MSVSKMIDITLKISGNSHLEQSLDSQTVLNSPFNLHSQILVSSFEHINDKGEEDTIAVNQTNNYFKLNF